MIIHGLAEWALGLKSAAKQALLAVNQWVVCLWVGSVMSFKLPAWYLRKLLHLCVLLLYKNAEDLQNYIRISTTPNTSFTQVKITINLQDVVIFFSFSIYDVEREVYIR